MSARANSTAVLVAGVAGVALADASAEADALAAGVSTDASVPVVVVQPASASPEPSIKAAPNVDVIFMCDLPYLLRLT